MQSAPAGQPSARASTRAAEEWTEHWTNFARMTAHNPAQAYRRKLVFEHLGLERVRGPVRLLDMGSGTGEMARDVLSTRADASVLGLDCSASGVAMARRLVPQAMFSQQDFTQPCTLGQEYRGWATHAVCSEVLEHLDAPSEALRNVRDLLSPDCRLVVTVPAGPMSAFDKHIGHRRHFTPALLERTLREAGLNVLDLRGAGFPFFNAYRLVVVARGRKLITDVGRAEDRPLPSTALAVMRAFSWLFRLNSGRTKLGWQLVAVASPAR